MSLRLNSPPTEKVGALENRHTTRLAHPRGTNGSNLVSSRRESSANLTTDDVTGLHSSVSPPTSKLRKNEVRSLVLDTSRSSATLVYRPAGENPAEFVSRLADAVAGSGEELDVDALPHWPEGEPVTLHRQGEVVSLVEILNLANGRLVAHHPDIARDPAMADRVENILRRAAGVIEVAVTSAKAELRVRFNPRVITAVTLIRLVEAELLQPRSTETAPPPGRVNFAPANGCRRFISVRASRSATMLRNSSTRSRPSAGRPGRSEWRKPICGSSPTLSTAAQQSARSRVYRKESRAVPGCEHVISDSAFERHV